MTEVDSALTQISAIRSQLAASTSFNGLGPALCAAFGGFSLLLALVQSAYPATGPDANVQFITVWALFIASVATVAAFTTYGRSKRLHGALANSLLGSVLQRLLPIFAFCVVVSFVIGRFSVENVWMLPGLWLMLIGLVGFLSVPILPRGIVWAAVWYFLCGAIVMVMAAQSRVLSPWMLGFPMFAGQVIVTMTLMRAGGACDEIR